MKDIFDLARITHVRPLHDHQFWLKAGGEFRLACESRVIDCLGLDSFEQDLDTTRSTYENDPTIPNKIQFTEAWNSIREIATYLEANGIVPFEFPLD